MNTPTYALPRRPLINNLSLFSVLVMSIGLSALDGLSTLVLLDRGIASEGNPVMAVLIRQDPAIFFAVKMTLTVLGLLLCYQPCERRPLLLSGGCLPHQLSDLNGRKRIGIAKAHALV